MTRVNKYYNRSHISEAKFRQIMKLFVQDLPASKIADWSGVSRVSINKLLFKIRCRLAHVCEQASPFFGEIEVDESDFGARRIKGKRGHGASGKTIVFGLLKRLTGMFIQRSFLTPLKRSYSRLSGAR